MVVSHDAVRVRRTSDASTNSFSSPLKTEATMEWTPSPSDLARQSAKSDPTVNSLPGFEVLLERLGAMETKYQDFKRQMEASHQEFERQVQEARLQVREARQQAQEARIQAQEVRLEAQEARIQAQEIRLVAQEARNQADATIANNLLLQEELKGLRKDFAAQTAAQTAALKAATENYEQLRKGLLEMSEFDAEFGRVWEEIDALAEGEPFYSDRHYNYE
ncbi:hypothetical protein V8F06_010106 [Rhypophila decipiens]